MRFPRSKSTKRSFHNVDRVKACERLCESDSPAWGISKLGYILDEVNTDNCLTVPRPGERDS